MKKYKLTNFNHERGVTLIESVVALLVFSVGALGIAALQTVTLVRSDDVKQRSIAVWKAQELADRIRATRSIDDTAGLAAAFVTAVGDDISVIGSFDDSGALSCAGAVPTRCDDTTGNAVAQCTVDQIVTFDIWSVVCDPVNGASDVTIDDDIDGNSKLKNLDVALERTATGEMHLYFEWLSRAADQNAELLSDGNVENINTELCGNIIPVDARLETYCLRFF